MLAWVDATDNVGMEDSRNTSLKIAVYRAGRNGLATLVLVGPVFLKVKIKLHFYKKQVVNKSASVIFGLVKLNR